MMTRREFLAWTSAAMGEPLLSFAQETPPDSLLKKWRREERWLRDRAREWKGKRSPVEFGAQLLGAHPAFLYRTELSVLLAWIDGLSALGIAAIDLNPTFDPWARPKRNTEKLQKLDRVIERIQEKGMKVRLSYEYAVKKGEVADWDEYVDLELRTLREWIRRYSPHLINVVHEPTTMEERWGKKVALEDWVGLVRRGGALVKETAPKTLTGAGGLVYHEKEREFLDTVTELREVDWVRFNIYGTGGFDTIDEHLRRVRRSGKKAYIGETWRCPVPESDEEQGFTHPCEPLDAAWVQVLTAYAQERGMVAISPFFSNLFFHYVPYPQSDQYWKRLAEALPKGHRTKVFDGYRDAVK